MFKWIANKIKRNKNEIIYPLNVEKHTKIKETTVQEAGRKGGLKTYARYGKKHYQMIGRIGGLKRHAIKITDNSINKNTLDVYS